MKKLRTFKCTACDKMESRFADDETKELECTECNSPTIVQLSAPKYFNNSVGRSPSAL